MLQSWRAFYSLNGIGCRAGGLAPATTTFIYRTYCQPIVTYGMEMLHISKSSLKRYDSQQSTLIKNAVGFSKYLHSSTLLRALDVNTIVHTYYRMKFIFMRQLMGNHFTTRIIEYLLQNYTYHQLGDRSFVKQISDAFKIISVNDVRLSAWKTSLTALSNVMNPQDDELTRKVRNLCKMMGEDKVNFNLYKSILIGLLSVEHSSDESTALR